MFLQGAESPQSLESPVSLTANLCCCFHLSACSILAAYDLGAAPGLLQKIYDDEAKVQRPIHLDDKDEEIVISQDNWKQFIGNIKLESPRCTRCCC